MFINGVSNNYRVIDNRISDIELKLYCKYEDVSLMQLRECNYKKDKIINKVKKVLKILKR